MKDNSKQRLANVRRLKLALIKNSKRKEKNITKFRNIYPVSFIFECVICWYYCLLL